MWSRPAVSRISTSTFSAFACFRARRQTLTATPVAFPYSAHWSGSA